MLRDDRLKTAVCLLLLLTSALYCCPRRVWLPGSEATGRQAHVAARVQQAERCPCDAGPEGGCNEGTGSEPQEDRPRCQDCRGERFGPQIRSGAERDMFALPHVAVMAVKAPLRPTSMYLAIREAERSRPPGTLFHLGCLLLV
ncbi:MAG: hypothetical protein JSV91_00490 [Phycisphaerales bacterium]|nr:MAG: hypothetical protein JSV91_00490 [Phycisphaerales bacterium]